MHTKAPMAIFCGCVRVSNIVLLIAYRTIQCQRKKHYAIKDEKQNQKILFSFCLCFKPCKTPQKFATMDPMEIDESQQVQTIEKLLQLPPLEFNNNVDTTNEFAKLVKIMNAVVAQDENDQRTQVVKKRIKALSRDATNTTDDNEFKNRINYETNYATLSKIASKVAKDQDKKRLRIVNKRITDLHKDGQVTKRVRVEGTGTRVEKEFTYANSRVNQMNGLAGKTYTRAIWEGAEYEYVPRNIRKRHVRTTEDASKKPPNKWILALQKARAEMGITGLVAVRREAKDRNDEQQILGERLYLRAREIMTEQKD